ncbi:cation diffusion facilitator family transporter [Pelomonas sp. P7]|uniref:Cation diffusion facilitator family transporter n=1 Tax=Pelomonas caseinilytica TaxID=2906763 RepID=A0ABS8XLH0_9BURK|nr:cation diffusion facilitator family transporter [Pelomonas sp. P7]MCE4538080.1 cation diffusion facilitator family transporter [Pelomonas sp. P7]
MPSELRSRESPVVLYGAIAANVAIAVTKFAVAAHTGSSAMLSEAVHSTVDTGNGLLMLFGLHRSRRPPNAVHPFGHGRELYFWSLIVAVLIFGLGGGVSFYEGVRHLRHPLPAQQPFWNYVVLGAALLFEGTSFAIAWRQFRREARDRPTWAALRLSKDPTTYTVVAEDAAALLGLLVAAAGIALAEALGRPEIDALASMVIGLLLAGVALLLVREARGLLVGEGVQPHTAEALVALARAHVEVVATGPVLSMYIGPKEALLVMELGFAPGVSAERAAQVAAALRGEIRERYPMLTRVYLGLLAGG